MNQASQTAPSSTKSAPSNRSAYWLSYFLLGALLCYILIARWYRPLVLEEEITVEPARVEQVEQRIDPNSATWSELATLPRVGEVIAKRIVEFRRDAMAERGSAVGAGPADVPPVFRDANDLQAVRGIGPKTVERITPYLKFPGG